VCVGRLRARKGIGNVISSLVSVPHTELFVASGPELDGLGGDREARRLVALAEEAGVADRVHLLGRVGRANVPCLLRSAPSSCPHRRTSSS